MTTREHSMETTISRKPKPPTVTVRLAENTDGPAIGALVVATGFAVATPAPTCALSFLGALRTALRRSGFVTRTAN